MKLYHMMCSYVGVIMRVQLLATPPPQNLGGQNTSKIHHDLGQLLSLTANISLNLGRRYQQAVNKRR